MTDKTRQWAVTVRMLPVYMECLMCSEPIRLSGGTGARVWTHSTLRMHMHNAMPPRSLIADLVDLAITERTEES